MSARDASSPPRGPFEAPPALARARETVAADARRATLRARARAVAREAVAHEDAARRVDRLAAALDAAVASARREGGGDGNHRRVVAVGRARVRRDTRATAGLELPVLAAVGPRGGGVCAVAGDDDLPGVLALLRSVLLGAAAQGALGEAPVLVVNPRARELPPSLAEFPGLRVARDAGPVLAAARAARRGDPPGAGAALGEAGSGAAVDPSRGAAVPVHLVALDFPHGMGLAGRRLVHDAMAGIAGAPRPLLVHVAADAPEVDVQHRRFRIPRCGVPMPEPECELWAARAGWRWRQHPGLVVRPGDPAGDAPPAGGGSTGGSHRALRDYGRTLDALVDAARLLDAELMAARRRERAELDAVARQRRARVGELLRTALADGAAVRVGGPAQDARPPPERGPSR